MKPRLWALALVFATTAPLGSQQPKAKAIVFSDGSGTHKTVREAIDAVPQNTSASNRWTILVKAGTGPAKFSNVRFSAVKSSASIVTVGVRKVPMGLPSSPGM